MILGVDTDVLVYWVMEGAPQHTAARRLLEREVRERGNRLGLTPQVLFEFTHICTDPRRFQNPLSMGEAIRWARALWDSRETVRIVPPAAVFHRAMELLETLALGRKRILDTALAATLESVGVRRLATGNPKDFATFAFLEIVELS